MKKHVRLLYVAATVALVVAGFAMMSTNDELEGKLAAAPAAPAAPPAEPAAPPAAAAGTDTGSTP
jgi:hypothetical protein